MRCEIFSCSTLSLDVSDRVAHIIDDSFQEPGEDVEKEGRPESVLFLVWISLDSIIHVKGCYVIIIIIRTIKFLPTYVPQAFKYFLSTLKRSLYKHIYSYYYLVLPPFFKVI
jgi:hypothetical protein